MKRFLQYANVVDVGPHLDAVFEYPEAGQSNEATYQVDYTNVFYELVIPAIWITPRQAYAAVNGSNVEFNVTGTNIPQGVTWSLIPDLSGSGGVAIQSNGAWQAEVTPGNVVTNYKVRATSIDNTNFYDQVSLTIIKVDIKRDGSVITDTITDMMVGKKINLTGEVSPAGLTIANKQWTIPATTVKTYSQTMANGSKTNLAPTDLQQDNISYYWIDGGDAREVKYTVILWEEPHAMGSLSSTSNVQQPL